MTIRRRGAVRRAAPNEVRPTWISSRSGDEASRELDDVERDPPSPGQPRRGNEPPARRSTQRPARVFGLRRGNHHVRRKACAAPRDRRSRDRRRPVRTRSSRRLKCTVRPPSTVSLTVPDSVAYEARSHRYPGHTSNTSACRRRAPQPASGAATLRSGSPRWQPPPSGASSPPRQASRGWRSGPSWQAHATSAVVRETRSPVPAPLGGSSGKDAAASTSSRSWRTSSPRGRTRQDAPRRWRSSLQDEGDRQQEHEHVDVPARGAVLHRLHHRPSRGGPPALR